MPKIIAIQLSKFFTKASWEDSFNRYFPSYTEEFTVVYASTKKELKDLYLGADACFCFELSADMNISDSKMQLLYMGITDIDYMNTVTLPDNIHIYTSKGMASAFIAEYSLMTSLMLIRNFQYSVINQMKKMWDQDVFLNHPAGSLRNYKIGVLGLGKSGKAIVDIFKSIGCWVAGYSKTENKDMALDFWASPNKLNELLEIADIIIVSLPLRNETKHVIGHEQFELMGSESYLINVSRGDIINENDLIVALKKHIIKAAAIDVCSIEPLPQRSNLWKIPNLLISPHIAGNINYFIDSIQRDFIRRVKDTASRVKPDIFINGEVSL